MADQSQSDDGAPPSNLRVLPGDYRLNARINNLLAAVDHVLAAEEKFGAPMGWEGWLLDLRRTREKVP